MKQKFYFLGISDFKFEILFIYFFKMHPTFS